VDFDLLSGIWELDLRFEILDLITIAQARYYMGQRPDGRIPPVLRQQIERIKVKCLKRAPNAA